ncbi:MAG: HAD hydrolase-like protein [Armatimonadetes bacterium]|nr:HAD hydrolase-like protein [Armatimonadota bacterium]
MYTLPADLVIFDFDGVLCAAERFTPDAIRDGLRAFAQRCGVPIDEPDEAALLATLGYPSHQTYPPMLPESLRPRWPEMHTLTLDAMERRIRALGRWGCLYDGVPELLDDLLADGRTLALASNCSERYQAVHREVHGLDRWFTHQWHAQAAGIGSKADMVARILADTPALRTSVMVGDRLSDRNAAAAHRVPFVAAAYGFGCAAEWDGAVAVADHVVQLRAILGV